MPAKEKSNCPICYSKINGKIKLITTKNGIDRIQCNSCGCMFFLQEEYERPIYDYNYNHHFRRPTDVKKAGIMACKISQYLGYPNEKIKILEIGTGNGLFTALMDSMGYDIDAMDIDEKLCKELKQRLNIKIIQGEFEKIKLSKKYNFIYLPHIIEHIENPISFMLKVNEVLDEGGKTYIETPNAEEVLTEGCKWRHFKTRHEQEHCSLFEQDTIKAMAKATGFSVVRIETNKDYGSLDAILMKNKK